MWLVHAIYFTEEMFLVRVFKLRKSFQQVQLGKFFRVSNIFMISATLPIFFVRRNRSTQLELATFSSMDF